MRELKEIVEELERLKELVEKRDNLMKELLYTMKYEFYKLSLDKKVVTSLKLKEMEIEIKSLLEEIEEIVKKINGKNLGVVIGNKCIYQSYIGASKKEMIPLIYEVFKDYITDIGIEFRYFAFKRKIIVLFIFEKDFFCSSMSSLYFRIQEKIK